MGRPVDKRTLEAYELLSKPHPLSPSGMPHTVKEAAEKAGVRYNTLVQHVLKQKRAAK